MRKLGVFFWLGALAALAACTPSPTPATAPLWQIEAPNGERGWLLGTIHSLARPAAWRTEMVDRALGAAGVVVVEVDDLANQPAMAKTFAKLARSPDQPPLSARVDPQLRSALAALLKKGGISEGQFASTETWAAALTLARVGDRSLDSAYGIDRAVIDAAEGKRVVELEGASGQLAIFDALPEKEQRDLLDAVVRDSARTGTGTDSGSLAKAWRDGDMVAIERETRRGMLADPELRQALFAGRNRAWAERIATMIGRDARPFVAVGAAHMTGPDGLPAMLQAKGYRITRLQ